MKYWKRMIAPIMVALVILSYYIGIAGFLTVVTGVPSAIKVLLLFIPLLLIAALFG